MCRQLGVSRSGYYAWLAAAPSQRTTDDAALTTLIATLFRDGRGNPGVRRVRAGLAALGRLLSHKRVWRLMKAAGLRGRHPKAWKRTTIAGDHPMAAPDLLSRDFTAEGPNEKWCGDITYVKTWDGWAYVATVIDLHSRAVVGWAVADHMRTDLVTAALDTAIARRRPAAGVLFHSDRGSTRPHSSTGTAPSTRYDGHSAGPVSATTTLSPSRSSRRTRRNSSIPAPGQPSRP